MQAKLNGLLEDDGGEVCTCWFQWGLTTSYGMETPKIGGLVLGNAFASVVTGLSPGTTYHFRAVAQHRFGTIYGNDQFITTAPEPFLMSLTDYQLLRIGA